MQNLDLKRTKPTMGSGVQSRNICCILLVALLNVASIEAALYKGGISNQNWYDRQLSDTTDDAVCVPEIITWTLSGTCSNLPVYFDTALNETDTVADQFNLLCDEDALIEAMKDVDEDVWEDECADSSEVEDVYSCMREETVTAYEDEFGFECSGSVVLHLSAMLVALYCFLAAFFL